MEVGYGILLSMGQVYAVNNLLSSLIITLAVALYSPILALMSLLGATLGSVVPLIFINVSSLSQVYTGLWGYSSILSMAGVSCAILPFSKVSFVAGFVNVVTTVFIQKLLGETMEQVTTISI